MTGLNAAATLDLWERARRLDPVWRAVELAAASEPAVPVEEAAELPLGRRDARLLRVRGAAMGSAFDATAVCHACGERVEFVCDVEQLLEAEPQAMAPVPLEIAGFVVHWRPPASRDVDAAARARSLDVARELLLERCVKRATGPDGEVPARELPAVVFAALEDAIVAADPLAEVLIDLVCPGCAEPFVADLDIASFVWTEFDLRARHVLGDVDALARTYGWTESEVLALGEDRRATYLRLARAEQA
jgi:hypothetical protein